MADRAFTLPGKAAPPMPTMPASRISPRMVSGSICSGEAAVGAGMVVSWKSLSMTTDMTFFPEAWGRGSTATTVPETEACTGTHRPSPSPIF